MTELFYQYDPYFRLDPDDTSTGEHEIPCFRIYAEKTGEPVAETNESLPADVQERYARLFSSAPKLLDALDYFFNIMHDYESSTEKGYVHDAMEMARATLTAATGRKP